MGSNLFLHTIFIITFILFSVSFCKDDEYFKLCNRSDNNCGTIQNIQYPFWGIGRSSFCGHQEFELRCENGEYPVLNSDGQEFRLLKLNQPSYIMTIARMDLWDGPCSTHPGYLDNTTLNSDLFNLPSTVRYITLYYNCTGNFSRDTMNSFNCSRDGVESVGFYAEDSLLKGNAAAAGILVECEMGVRVPVLRTVLGELGIGGLKIEEALKRGFEVDYDAVRGLCSECEVSGGICGSDHNNSLRFACLCRDNKPYRSVCQKNGDRKWGLKSTLGVIAIGVGILLLCIVFLCFSHKFLSIASMEFWRKRSKNDQNLEDFIRNHGSLALKRYNFSSVKKMTNSFRDKLGKGGYGEVYKGKLPDGQLVAVKLLNASKGNGEEFINEVASISKTSHVNIVALLGFCLEPHKRVVIYEFMPNGSLEKFICKDNSLKSGSHLGWKKLYQIAIGIARGLEYLHRGCNTRILHFDIKPHNILLDEDFCPKISDFGMAKLCPGKESIISMLGARGTIGYIAPEVFSRNFGGVSHKSDVYSFGMMVLEMVGATEKINFRESDSSEMYFPQWVYKHLEMSEDMGLQGVMSMEESDIVRKMILVGLWCIQTIPSIRPSMSKVIEMLEGSLETLQIPPKPFFSSPSTLTQEISTTSTSS